MKKIFVSIWFSWIVLTVAYILLMYINVNLRVEWFRKIAYLVGLFVPFGAWNLSGAFTKPLQVAILLVIFVALVYLVDLFFRGRNISSGIRISINLILLFVLTFAVDMLLWNGWCSLELLTHGRCEAVAKMFSF